MTTISLNDIVYLFVYHLMTEVEMARKDSINIGELTDAAFYILSSVVEEKHGYLIMKTIENLTDGKFTIDIAIPVN